MLVASYDNAASMAGACGGVQTIIKVKKKEAIFSGCMGHGLS